MSTEERLLHEVTKIREEVKISHDELRDEHAETGKALNRILLILESDPKVDTKGLVERVNDHEEDIDRIKKVQSELGIKARVYGGVAGGIVTILGFLARFFFLK